MSNGSEEYTAGNGYISRDKFEQYLRNKLHNYRKVVEEYKECTFGTNGYEIYRISNIACITLENMLEDWGFEP